MTTLCANELAIERVNSEAIPNTLSPQLVLFEFGKLGRSYSFVILRRPLEQECD